MFLRSYVHSDNFVKVPHRLSIRNLFAVCFIWGRDLVFYIEWMTSLDRFQKDIWLWKCRQSFFIEPDSKYTGGIGTGRFEAAGIGGWTPFHVSFVLLLFVFLPTSLTDSWSRPDIPFAQMLVVITPADEKCFELVNKGPKSLANYIEIGRLCYVQYHCP